MSVCIFVCGVYTYLVMCYAVLPEAIDEAMIQFYFGQDTGFAFIVAYQQHAPKTLEYTTQQVIVVHAVDAYMSIVTAFDTYMSIVTYIYVYRNGS